MANAPVTELVLSPRWTVTVGHIGGTPHVILRIDHPRLGPLDFLLPDNHAIEFAAALEKTWEQRDAGRMSPAAPPKRLRYRDDSSTSSASRALVVTAFAKRSGGNDQVYRH